MTKKFKKFKIKIMLNFKNYKQNFNKSQMNRSLTIKKQIQSLNNFKIKLKFIKN